MIYPHWLWQIVITKKNSNEGTSFGENYPHFQGPGTSCRCWKKKHLKTLQNIKYSTPLASIFSSSPLHLPILDVYPMFRNIQLILSCTDSQSCWSIPTFKKAKPQTVNPWKPPGRNWCGRCFRPESCGFGDVAMVSGDVVLDVSLGIEFFFEILYQSMAISGSDSLEVPTVYKAYVSGLCKGISPQNMALYGTVPPF